MSDLKPVIKISVRNLIEFILRCGDINSGFSGSKRAVEGTRVHRKIQKSQKENYKAEVPVTFSVDLDSFNLVIDGRIDGVLLEGDQCFIDEIKSVTEPVNNITENSYPLHWAQLTCYAFMFSSKESLVSADLRLIYCEVESGEISTFTRHMDKEDLDKFFNDLISKYKQWAEFSFRWISSRDESLKRLTFPFMAYRSGQREFAVSVYRSIEKKNNLFAKAPTGTGKTVSTMFPTLKAMGEGHVSRIFYLTAKTITRTVAEDTVGLMRKQNIHLKSITLTAKDKICFKDKKSCTPQNCEYACGHFDRINDAIWDIVNGHDEFKRAIIEEYAQKHRVCPFEFALDISLFCDVIIGDYNYVFDPQVYLKRFFSENGGNYVFLIDEAHNLVERSREMFSAKIEYDAFTPQKKKFKSAHPAIYKIITRVQNRIRALGKMCGELNNYQSKDLDEKLCLGLKQFVDECELVLVKNRSFDNEDLLQLYFDSLIFLRVSELFDSRYLLFVEKNGRNVVVKLFCIDPSFLMSEALKRGRSSIFFSATLAPLSYYREMLGGSEKDQMVSLSSPFDTANRCFMIASDVSTRFQNRDQSFSVLSDYLCKVIQHRKGNYLSFFPSYKYMNSVVELFKEKNPHVTTIVQSSIMSEGQRDEFLENFKPDPNKTVLGFCVLGGVFSEGIDLKADRLIGSIIIGVGLPQICVERDIIRDYFQQKKNCGYEYAYLYPGMNKVMQAAGRVIRSEDDRGVILLIDQRYTGRQYLKLFPAEWFPHNRVLLHTIDDCINGFWGVEKRNQESLNKRPVGPSLL